MSGTIKITGMPMRVKPGIREMLMNGEDPTGRYGWLPTEDRPRCECDGCNNPQRFKGYGLGRHCSTHHLMLLRKIRLEKILQGQMRKFGATSSEKSNEYKSIVYQLQPGNSLLNIIGFAIKKCSIFLM